MIRTIVFDFDGTLALSNGIKRQSYFDVAARFGDVAGIVEEVLAREPGTRAKVLAGIVEALRAGGGLSASALPDDLVSELVRQYTERCEERISCCPEVPGAMSELRRLQAKGYALFINSATPTEPLERILRLRGMTPFFKGILGSPAGKVENLERILLQEAAAPAEMVLVGDNEVDRAAAAEVGCHFIGIENEYSGYSPALPSPLKDLMGLKTALENLESRLIPTSSRSEGKA